MQLRDARFRPSASPFIKKITYLYFFERFGNLNPYPHIYIDTKPRGRHGPTPHLGGNKKAQRFLAPGFFKPNGLKRSDHDREE